METVVYLIRHSIKSLNKFYAEYNVQEDWKQRDEKKVLSVDGEKRAEKFCKNSEFDKVQVIYSSHYSRAIGTAKYLAERLELPINIDYRLGERIHGKSDSMKPEIFYYNQHHDFDFKLPSGESINDTKKRFLNVFEDIVFTHHEKNVALFTHEHTIISFLTQYCEVGYSLDNELVLTYNEHNFTTNFNQPDAIKVTLENNEVINIEKIEIGE